MFFSHVLLVCLASPPVSAPAEANVYTVQHRAFRVPVQVESRRNEIEQIVLFVSTDQGKTWKAAQRTTYNFFEISSGVGASSAWIRVTR